MSIWRCPRCGSIAVVEPQFGDVVAVFDLCNHGGDLRAHHTPVRMEAADPSVLDEMTREPELVGSH